jgi:hypothetical protein
MVVKATSQNIKVIVTRVENERLYAMIDEERPV